MCPGCYAVIYAGATGLRPLLEASDLAFLNGWQYVKFDEGYTKEDGEEVRGSGGYVCPLCIETFEP